MDRISVVYLQGTHPEQSTPSARQRLFCRVMRINFELVFGVVASILIWVGFFLAFW